MNILIISTSDKIGGAAIASSRLMHALQNYRDAGDASGDGRHCDSALADGVRRGEGIAVRMLVRDKVGSDDSVFQIKGTASWKKFLFLFERLVIFVNNGFSKANLFHVSIADTGLDVASDPLVKWADVIHVHWTQQGMLSLSGFKALLATGRPVVVTMHDMWYCTAICHYSEDCMKFIDKCSGCRYLAGGGIMDLSGRIFSRKKKVYAKDFTVVCCSDWIKEKASASALLSGKKIVSIPNPIDTSVFKPSYSKAECRKALGLPENRKLILFVSQKVTDKRKGIDYLVKASVILKEQGVDASFVVMGNKSEQLDGLLGLDVFSLGYVSSIEKSVLVYQACDLFVTPSLMDNLPNTVMEAMACGLPCVGFAVGGIPEMIDHKVNGYLAACKDASDLASGIGWVLSQEDESLSEACVEKVSRCYAMDSVAARFVSLYRSLLERSPRSS